MAIFEELPGHFIKHKPLISEGCALQIYLSGLKTHRYLSHPIAIMAKEDKNTGIF